MIKETKFKCKCGRIGMVYKKALRIQCPSCGRMYKHQYKLMKLGRIWIEIKKEK